MSRGIVQIRYGSTAQINAVVLPIDELTHNRETGNVHVGDGITAGGGWILPAMDTSGNLTISGYIRSSSLDILSSSFPTLSITDSSAATDNKTYDWLLSSTTLYGRIVNDAYSAATNWQTITRSGMTVTGIALQATTHTWSPSGAAYQYMSLVANSNQGAQLIIGANATTGDNFIQLGEGRTGSGNAYIDLVGDTTYSDFGMRLIRTPGANGPSYIQHRGTGELNLYTYEAASIDFYTTATFRIRIDAAGLVGIGIAPNAKLHTSDTANGTIAIFAGSTKGVRILISTSGSAIEGVDQTGGASYQPLTIGGSLLGFATANVPRFLIGNGLYSAGATGGDKGVDTINTGTYYSNGVLVAALSGVYIYFSDGAGNQDIFLGSGGDPSNYYRNTNHHFGNIAGAVNYLDMNGTNAVFFLNVDPGTDNTYSLGGGTGNRWSVVYAANGTIQTSDERDKILLGCDLGLDFICALEPQSWRWKVGGNKIVGYTPIWNGFGHLTGNEPILEPQPGKRIHYGLVAQQVKEVLGDRDFGGWVLENPDDPDSMQSLRMDQFIAPLIASVKELRAEIEELKRRFS